MSFPLKLIITSLLIRTTLALWDQHLLHLSLPTLSTRCCCCLLIRCRRRQWASVDCFGWRIEPPCAQEEERWGQFANKRQIEHVPGRKEPFITSLSSPQPPTLYSLAHSILIINQTRSLLIQARVIEECAKDQRCWNRSQYSHLQPLNSQSKGLLIVMNAS